MRRRIGTALVAGLAFLGLGFSPGVASAAVSSLPAATPQLGTSGTDGTIEQVRQIVQCGTTMYAVGLFSQVKNPNSSVLIARNNTFAFSAVSPYRVTAWNPNVNGQVDTVACDAGTGSLLLGGVFSSVHGVAVKNIARVNGTTGAVDPAFTHTSIGGRVAHIEIVGGHALVGGYFTPTKTTPGYLRSLDPLTGADDGYITTTLISGNYFYTDPLTGKPAAPNATRIWNMTVSPDSTAVLMTGVFTSVGGQHHEQIFRLDLTPNAPTVSAWAPSDLFLHCATNEPFYAQDAAWSTDMKTIFTATTGDYQADPGSSAGPRTGPCDAALAFSAAAVANGAHLWVNYTGCDSYFSVAADASTVFNAGHQRWVSNPNACDQAGSGAIVQPGLSELDPATGIYQPGPNRGRGLGADDLLRTTAGLWIASDNQANTAACAGKAGHMGICFLPN